MTEEDRTFSDRVSINRKPLPGTGIRVHYVLQGRVGSGESVRAVFLLLAQVLAALPASRGPARALGLGNISLYSPP